MRGQRRNNQYGTRSDSDGIIGSTLSKTAQFCRFSLKLAFGIPSLSLRVRPHGRVDTTDVPRLRGTPAGPLGQPFYGWLTGAIDRGEAVSNGLFRI